jgi:YegS/Rv2252/BmrU family lipid kinase
MKKNILFVVNNLSGSVAKYNIPKCIDIFLDKEQYDYKTYFIDNVHDESAYSSLFDSKVDIVVAVGGDGTILEMGTKLVENNLTLGIVPIGSGNGLASHLGYLPRNIEAAFNAINNGKTIDLDVAKANNKYFFSNLGVGLDAIIAKKFKTKKKRNFLSYAYLTISSIFPRRFYKIKYTLNNQTKEVEAMLFNVFNSSFYGYNVGILPWASATDGMLDLVYLSKFNILKMPFIAICILLKKPNWVKEMHYEQMDHIEIEQLEKGDFQLDGDPIKNGKHLNVSILPGKLKTIIP